MNTRASLYANEASKLLDTVSAYKTLYTEQLLRLFPPGKADTVRMLLRRLAKDHRLYPVSYTHLTLPTKLVV